jgi:hypothetical protein
MIHPKIVEFTSSDIAKQLNFRETMEIKIKIQKKFPLLNRIENSWKGVTLVALDFMCRTG